jgi:hypothetical protein
LARLLPATGDPALPYDRQLRLEDHLMRETEQNPAAAPAGSASPRRSRRRLACFLVPGALIALAGSAVAATEVMGSSPASLSDSVRCYSADRLNAQYTGTSMTAATRGASLTGISSTVTSAVNACAGLWASTLVQPGKSGPPTVRPGDRLTIPSAKPGQGKVPPLTACVLESGEAAVYPGNDRKLCQNLGLAELADRSHLRGLIAHQRR